MIHSRSQGWEGDGGPRDSEGRGEGRARHQPKVKVIAMEKGEEEAKEKMAANF